MLPGETHRLVHRVEIEMSALRFSEVRENDRDSRIKLAPHNWLVSGVAIPHPALNGRANPEPHRLGGLAQSSAIGRLIFFLGYPEGDEQQHHRQKRPTFLHYPGHTLAGYPRASYTRTPVAYSAGASSLTPAG